MPQSQPKPSPKWQFIIDCVLAVALWANAIALVVDIATRQPVTMAYLIVHTMLAIAFAGLASYMMSVPCYESYQRLKALE